MKTIIFINNVYHNHSKERLSSEIRQLELYCEKNNRRVHDVMIANTLEELEVIKKHLAVTKEIGQGDGVITLEISDISKDDNQTKEFVMSLYDRGITFRAFYEHFNTETEEEKELLLNCLDILINFEGTIPF